VLQPVERVFVLEAVPLVEPDGAVVPLDDQQDVSRGPKALVKHAQKGGTYTTATVSSVDVDPVQLRLAIERIEMQVTDNLSADFCD
jgi:hypothetical protein